MDRRILAEQWRGWPARKKEKGNIMNTLQTRREFLKTSGKLLAGVALATTLSPVVQAIGEEKKVEAPAHPFPYQKLDPATVEARAYKSFYNKEVGGCCYAVVEALVGQLQDQVGYPFNQYPVAAAANGAGGYGAGSLCGSLGGAADVIGLVCAPADAKKITAALFSWYRETPFPIYQPEIKAEKTTVANSVNCLDSVGLFMKENDIADMKADPRKARCAGVSADVAKKTAELLNAHYGV